MECCYDGYLPAVAFLKAPTYEDGHPIDSTPTDEQKFLVNTINRLQSLPEWNSTAVIITYDDSGGWYDHAMPPIVSQSNDPQQAIMALFRLQNMGIGEDQILKMDW